MPECIVCQQPQKYIFSYKTYDYYRCDFCGLVSTTPLPDEKTIAEHYEKGFKEGNYLRLRQWSAQYRKIYQDMANFLIASLDQRGQTIRGSRVLDIGCFTGDFLVILNKMGADCFGLELQKEAVEIALQELPGKIYQADVYNEVFPDQTFDIVTMNGLIEHVLDPKKMIGRCFEMLKPGGTLMIQTPDSGSLLARSMGRSWPPIAPVEHIFLFSRKSLEIQLKKCGFQPLKYKSHVKWLPVDYVYNNMTLFGPELQERITPFYKPLQRTIGSQVLPFYGGEMLLIAEKPATAKNV